jgi:hypothetical protein
MVALAAYAISLRQAVSLHPLAIRNGTKSRP